MEYNLITADGLFLNKTPRIQKGDWEIGRLGDWEIGRLGDWGKNTADSRFMKYIQYPVGTRQCRVPTRTMYLTYQKSAVLVDRRSGKVRSAHLEG